MSWTCTVCGEVHDEQLRDIRAGLPDAVFELDEDERRRRAEFGDDFGRLTDDGTTRYFVRALLHLAIGGSGDEFRYGVWAEVDENGYRRLEERWHDPDGSECGPVFGVLANELRPYSNTRGLPLALQLRDVRILPAAIVLTDEHELGRAQRDSISPVDASGLAEAALH